MGDDEHRSSPGAAPENPAHLMRMHAEEIHRQNMARTPELFKATSSMTAQHMLHELHVHQIELEMQNEELRRAHVELSESRENYFELYDLAPVGYCSIDAKGLIVQANLTLATLLGVERAAMIQHSFSRFIAKDQQDVFYFFKKRLVQDGGTQSCELQMVRTDGGRFWASLAARLSLDAESAPILRITIADVSERKEAESRLLSAEREIHGLRLLEKERQLHVLVDSAMDAIIAVDDTFHIVLYNPAAAEMFGVPVAEAIGGTLDRFLPARFQATHEGEIEAFGGETLAARGIAKDRQIVGVRKDGAEFLIEAKISHAEVGGKTLYTAIMRDLTQRNLAEEALNLSRQKLRELVAHQQGDMERMRSRIAAEIHDEVGSLLVGIKGDVSRTIVDFERSEPIRIERLKHACAMIDSAGEEVRKMIVELHPSVLDVLGIWEALHWFAEETELRTGLRCRVAIDQDAVDVDLDMERRSALFRIFQEALTNVARHAQATSVDVRIGMQDGAIRMEVDDDGKGIDTGAKIGSGSWGIAGMAERARHFGGDIEIANLSPGTRISVRLPLGETDP